MKRVIGYPDSYELLVRKVQAENPRWTLAEVERWISEQAKRQDGK